MSVASASLKILALDTATDACSAALLIDNQIHEQFLVAKQQHAALILPMLDQLLQTHELSLSQLDAVAFSCGPGSFTGIRIAASVVQAIAFAHNLPVIRISTLQALAQKAYREQSSEAVLACLDARMQEIYWGVYTLQENQLMQAIAPDTLIKPEAVHLPYSTAWLGVGSGWESYFETLQAKLGAIKWLPQYFPQARDIAQLAVNEWHKGNMVTAEYALPVYLRDEVVKIKPAQ